MMIDPVPYLFHPEFGQPHLGEHGLHLRTRQADKVDTIVFFVDGGVRGQIFGCR